MRCLRIYATPDGSLISVMLIFPRRPCLSFLMKPRFKFPVIIPRRAYASCTFQQGFAKRVGISHPDECSQCGLTASWNLRRPTEKCAEFQLGVRFWWRIRMERGTSRGILQRGRTDLLLRC